MNILKMRFTYFFLIYSLSLPAFQLQSGAKLHQKYFMTTEEKCAQVHCKTVEDCLKIVIQSFHIDAAKRDADKFKQVEDTLNSDQQILLQTQKAASNYYFWQDPDDALIYKTAAKCLANQANIRAFLLEKHKKFIQGIGIVHFYQDMPSENQLVSRWIKIDLLHDSNPLEKYKSIAQKDLNMINNLSDQDRIDYPVMVHELYQMRESIRNSLVIIESECLKERERNRREQREDEEKKTKKNLADLQAQKLREAIENDRYIARAQQDQARAQENLVVAEQETTRKILLLTALLQSQIEKAHVTQNSINQSQREIASLESRISYNSTIHRQLHHTLAQYKKELEQLGLDNRLQQEIEGLKNKNIQLKQEIENAEILCNQIADQLAQSNRRSLTDSERKTLIEKYEQEKRKIAQRTKDVRNSQEFIDSLVKSACENASAIPQATAANGVKPSTPVAQAVAVNNVDPSIPVAQAYVVSAPRDPSQTR